MDVLLVITPPWVLAMPFKMVVSDVLFIGIGRVRHSRYERIGNCENA